MAEQAVPVSAVISDMTMPTEDGNEVMIPNPEHVSSLEPNAIVPANDPVLSLTDVYTPTDSLLPPRIMTQWHLQLCRGPILYQGHILL